ncbi:MAG: LPD38 domain-containing protein, partial [Arcobacteraceae bacterium]|nr:LPD38 domain-containing protein [Arcobacteraceae bacterium]
FKESTWQKFDRLMSFDEYSNRVAVAQNAIEEGANWFDAAYQVRDLNVDFSMVVANPVLRSVLKLLPFQQAAMNGMYKLIREIKDEGHNAATYGKAVSKLALKGFTYLTPIAIVAFLMNEDDERYKALTTDEMARFIWFFYDKNEQPIKIPVPFGLGAIFQKFPEYIMSMLFSDGDFVDKRYSDAVMFAVTHQMIAVPNGGIFDPVIQHLMNKNFIGSPIVSSQLQKVEPYLQYNNRTPELYKEIGETTGLSPLRLEHYTKGTLGYIESAITGMTQIALWDKEKFGEMPYSSKEDYIHGAFFKQFYKMNETSRTAWSEEYYKYREKIEEAYNSVQFTNKQIIKDKGDSYEDYLNKNDKVLLSSLKKFTTNLDAITAQLKKAEDVIIFDKKLNANEKEKKIDEIYKQQNTMFKQVYKEINKVVEEKK